MNWNWQQQGWPHFRYDTDDFTSHRYARNLAESVDFLFLTGRGNWW